MSDYAILEDDHIDEQETINVGNLIIDLESDLEKEKIEGAKHNVDLPNMSRCAPTDITMSNKSISSTKECGTSTSIGTITEPECLGPCEPGTSVTLEGIVWQETDGGILVVNVTWRGKTYVGALLDCTRHDWAPPRLCDSPASDIDAKTSKGVRPKRIVTRSNGVGLDEKNLLQTTGKLRNGKGRRIPSSNDPTCSKRQRETTDKPSNETSSAQTEANTPQNSISSTNSEKNCVPMNIAASSANDSVNNSSSVSISADLQESTQGTSNISIDRNGSNSPSLISCNEPNCNKKYRNVNGLLYHQSHAHSTENESSNEQEDISAVKDTDQEHKSSPSDNRDCNSPSQQQSPQMINQHQQNSQRPMTSIPSSQSLAEGPDFGSSRIPSPSSRNESSRAMHLESERRPSQDFKKIPNSSDVIHKSSSGVNQKQTEPLNHGSSSSRTQQAPSSKSSPQVIKQASNQPPISSADEGMKPSGTSTGPPPAPHQANCYFNPAFMANSYNPYALHSYFPRHMFDSMPPIPTSNAAMLSRLMNNMRNPPPPDSPSRLLSPSMPKNVPYNPFKLEPGGVLPPPQQLHPHQIPTSIALPGMPPMTNPSMPPIPVPPMQPIPPLPGGQSNLRMPSQGDSILPSTSQPPFLPPGSLNPALGIPGIGNPLAPLSMPNLIEEQMTKQFPRR